jgi:hypothetical protein
MGIPVVIVREIYTINISSSNLSEQAPSEAEAQCAELARGGKVFHYLPLCCLP